MGAGVVGTLVWAALEPLDRRVFRHDYSDVAVLGKTFTRGRGWLPLGLAIHAANGALFGLAYYEIARAPGGGTGAARAASWRCRALALFSTGAPRRPPPPGPGRGGRREALQRRQAFGQATFRHALFGLVLGLGAQDGSARPR